MVTICTASLIFSNSAFCPHSVFMCFVWIWEQTAIISLYNINWLLFITETESVYCAVRTLLWLILIFKSKGIWKLPMLYVSIKINHVNISKMWFEIYTVDNNHHFNSACSIPSARSVCLPRLPFVVYYRICDQRVIMNSRLFEQGKTEWYLQNVRFPHPKCPEV